jgi:hypothetical protein
MSTYFAIVTTLSVIIAVISEFTSIPQYEFYVLAIFSILFLLSLGAITFRRLCRFHFNSIIYSRGMSRVRRYFIDNYPDIERYIILDAVDSHPRLMRPVSIPRGFTFHVSLSNTAMIAALNSSLLVAQIYLSLKYIDPDISFRNWSMTLIPVIWTTSVYIHGVLQWEMLKTLSSSEEILFPSPDITFTQ